jgi:hypothetical protein
VSPLGCVAVITHEEIFLRLRDIFNAKMFNGNHMLEIEPMLLGKPGNVIEIHRV